jgi:serine O-acetyltransferase
MFSLIAKVQHRRFSKKYFLEIPVITDIGFGFYIGHGQCVVINATAKIGNNVNVSQFTSIGSNHDKAAVIGNNVYIGPNVCIVEDVVIGDNVIVGAGSVVTKSIPDNATSAGVPAKVLNVRKIPNIYVHNRWPV